jgi:hypothetical protein
MARAARLKQAHSIPATATSNGCPRWLQVDPPMMTRRRIN